MPTSPPSPPPHSPHDPSSSSSSSASTSVTVSAPTSPCPTVSPLSATSTISASPPRHDRPPNPPPPTAHPALEHAYVLGPKLGRGCFATVYKATRRADGHAVAVKVVDKKRLDAETANLLENELDILRVVSQHPGIVTLLDNVETPHYMYFIMDYVEGGPLLDRIVSRGSFSENDARILMRAILLTLQFLSQLGCVHRDIKPENILVDNYSRAWPVKLTDFGLSAKMQPNELLRDALGTPLFIAPEVLKAEGYDCSCDMWSLGVVLYIVLCGYPPFPYNDDPATLVRAIVNAQYTFPAHEWDHVSHQAKELVRAMLEIDPAKRISPCDALAHPWIAVAQSTSELPNRNLKSFNARRKLKASVVAVRTTFGFMRFVNSSASTRRVRPPDTREDLVRDVERSRELIRRMGISDGGKSMYDSLDKASTGELTNRSMRRSLVLPTGGVAEVLSAGFGAPAEARLPGESFWVDPGRSFDFESIESTAMQSRAKAMVAEVKEEDGVADEENPFLICNPLRAEDVARRKPLEQLDFGILGL